MIEPDPVAELELRVATEFSQQRGSWPNPPDADDYARHAEAMGLTVQVICDRPASTGCYYDVVAIYQGGAVFGRRPLCLVFEDGSRSVDSTWLLRPQ